jgi:hypothetical protein
MLQNMRAPFEELDRAFARQHELSRTEPPPSVLIA